MEQTFLQDSGNDQLGHTTIFLLIKTRKQLLVSCFFCNKDPIRIIAQVFNRFFFPQKISLSHHSITEENTLNLLLDKKVQGTFLTHQIKSLM